MKKLFLSIVLIAMAFGAVAQQANAPVIFEIGGKPYYKSQFMTDFLKSVGKDPNAAPTACTYEKRKALEDYVQLYVNFQAKLTDAYALGFDTMASVVRELHGYRNELAAPYQIDSTTLQQLLREAYDRNHYALHAAHILVPCREGDSPADTLKAYTHCLELLARIQGGEDFYAVSQQEMHDQRATSPDPTLREKADEANPMEGDLGCFTVLNMVYPFECKAYSLQPGEAGWVRSKYGYHVVKLFDRYEYYGKCQLAHIWIAEAPRAENLINSAYRQLEDGTDFGVVAKNYSTDRNTSKNGGIMPELACNQLPYAYVEQVAKGLKVGEYSQPFHTQFGWHIVKLLKQETIPAFEEMVPYYKSRMTRGERATKPKSIYIGQCKQKYGFVDYTQTKASKKKKKAPMMASLDAVRAVQTDSVFSAIFHCDTNTITDMRPLFKVGDQEYDSRDFVAYLLKEKHVSQRCDLDVYTRNRYEEFVNDRVFAYADSRLEQDNPEFAAIVEEYRQGLMIFAYNDRMVWSRAIADTVGFTDFYAQASTKHDYNDTNDAVYFWNERARVDVYTIADSACLAPEKALKQVRKTLDKKEARMGDVVTALMKKVDGKHCIAEQPVVTDTQLVEQGNQKLLSANEWRKGIYLHPLAQGYQILVVNEILAPELKSAKEARGYYLNDYQNYLEETNNTRLREKYNVTIHQEVVDEITY